MALPLTRNTSYSPGDPLKSADTNAIQDTIIALYGGIHTARTQTLWPSSAQLLPPDVEADITRSLAAIAVNAPGSTTTLYWGLRLPVGSRVLEVHFTVIGKSGSGTMTASLTEVDASGSSLSRGSNTATTTGTLSVTAIDYTLLDDHSYLISLACPNETIDITAAKLVYDHP